MGSWNQHCKPTIGFRVIFLVFRVVRFQGEVLVLFKLTGAGSRFGFKPASTLWGKGLCRVAAQV